MAKNISKKNIYKASIRLVQEDGYDKLTMRNIASSMGIKASSLYNHISGIDEIKIQIAKYAIDKLYNEQINSIENKSTKDDLYKVCLSYAKFASNNPDLYKIILELGSTEVKSLEEYGAYIAKPFLNILDSYDISEIEKIDLQRALRSSIHGFIDLMQRGFFTHIDEASSIQHSFEYNLKFLVDNIESKFKKKDI